MVPLARVGETRRGWCGPSHGRNESGDHGTQTRGRGDPTREAVLQESHREIRHLAGSLITAQDAERARIGRDLHDDVSQQLAALSIALSGFKRRAGNDAR